MFARLLLAAGLLGGSVLGVRAQDPAAAPTVSRPSLNQYTQRLRFVFADEEAAQAAEISIAPLFNAHHRAVSCRWDDNGTSDNEGARAVMQEEGIRGTWYLNGRHFSPVGATTDYLPIARQLLEGGNSIGGHSLTHPYITYFHSNRLFAETSGVRVDWESGLDQPLVSYAYSFVDLRPQPEGSEVLVRTLDSLRRAGFYHVAEFLNFFDDVPLQLELSPIMPPENRPISEFKEAVAWAYQDEQLTEKWPMVSNSMHAWYDTPRLHYGYDELRARFAILKELQDVWHCNQNQYASYRRQYGLTRLESLQRNGKEIEVALAARPSVIALNDDTPLTLTIGGGLDVEDVVAAYCDGVQLEIVTPDERWAGMVHVPHAGDQQLPVKIGHVANPRNEAAIPDEGDADFAETRGVLSFESDQLRLKLVHHGNEPLSNVQVTWRAPIGWELPNAREALGEVGDQEVVLTRQLSPTSREQDRLGRPHFAAQLDFMCDGEPGRIHFTCQGEGSNADASWPKHGFALLGPIPNDQVDVTQVARQWEQSGAPAQFLLKDGTVVRWREDAQDGYIEQAWLNPEYVRTMGTWDAESPTYLLRTSVRSSQLRPVAVVVSHDHLAEVLLNGERLESGQGVLKVGDNELAILYPGSTMSPATPRLAACFVRLADPNTGKRLEDVVYRALP